MNIINLLKGIGLSIIVVLFIRFDILKFIYETLRYEENMTISIAWIFVNVLGIVAFISIAVFAIYFLVSGLFDENKQQKTYNEK